MIFCTIARFFYNLYLFNVYVIYRYWSISGNDLTVGIRLQGIVNGWVGMGVSLNGGMRGADIAVVRYIPIFAYAKFSFLMLSFFFLSSYSFFSYHT